MTHTFPDNMSSGSSAEAKTVVFLFRELPLKAKTTVFSFRELPLR